MALSVLITINAKLAAVILRHKNKQNCIKLVQVNNDEIESVVKGDVWRRDIVVLQIACSTSTSLQSLRITEIGFNAERISSHALITTDIVWFS